MYAKIQITGILEVKTGMHIGGSSAFAAIGAVDSPVIKDARTRLPMIPGSSLKGKIRTLLAKEYNDEVRNPDDDAECLTRLFGCAKKGNVKRSRIIISDMFLTNEAALRKQGLQSLTEVKFENSISRTTAVANPRQIERIIRGSEFGIDIIYEVEDEAQAVEDISVFAEGLKLLQYDYLGGNGSRGYGKVVFRDLYAETVVGEVPENILVQCNEILKSAVREA
ncbi:MAG: type III-A CRISPR-associated RAMP protein Csm3 [Bacteroidales bacterium]|nr:type III-A CRISPR-associated RAMP protein Csm3 [Lachnoclostridium sp.]MCM1383154.1 type III-A CRISPR-associated RAMP protein Csm3 [Lachnoclostridium sp.]MCM1464620.1 type III-A CRISPR-associated RAMP protein Csm3 [Bacteroidales bacterium]